MIYQVLYLLCVWLPLRAKKELSREGQKTIQKYTLETLCDVWAFIKGAKSQESTSHLYLPFFSSCTVYPASELQPRVKSFSPCFYEAHTACHIPRTQQAGEKHQVPRMQIQVSGRRLSNAAFIQSPRYISYIPTFVFVLLLFCCIAIVFASQIKISNMK